MVLQAQGRVRSEDPWAEVRMCRDSGTEKRLSSVSVPKVKVGIYQHKRKITLQAGHPVTTAVHTQLPSSIRQDIYCPLSLR